MIKKYENILRISLVLLGLIFFYFAIDLILKNFSSFIFELKNNFNFDLSLIGDGFFYELLFYIIFGIFLIEIGIFYSNIFKIITSISIYFGVLLIIGSIFMFSFNVNTENLTQEIQPSIDSILIYTSDNYINDYYNESKNKDLTINIILFDKIDEELFYVNNLTLNQAEYICNSFEICNSYSNKDKILFSKIFIGVISSNIEKNSPELINTAIPISTIKTIIDNSGFDISLLDLINPTILESQYPINNEAKLNILKSSDSESLSISAKSLNIENTKKIWYNLDLPEGINDESKLKIIQLLLISIPELGINNNLKNIEIPIASLKSQIPDTIKDVLKYDIFTKNETEKINILNNIRNDCIIKEKYETLNEIDSQICQLILMTKYDNMIGYLSNMNSTEIGMNIDLNSTLYNYNSIDKINDKLNKNTSHWDLLLILSSVCFAFAFITYYLHFHLFNREIINWHVEYFISKKNLFLFLPSFLFFGFLILILTSGLLFEWLSKLNIETLTKGILIIETLPIFKVIISIFNLAFELMIFYLIFSLILYGIFYYLQKKEIEKNVKQEGF